MQHKSRPKQIAAHVHPDEWLKFQDICKQQNISSSEAISLFVGQVVNGNISDLRWGNIPSVQNEIIAALSERLAKLEKDLGIENK